MATDSNTGIRAFGEGDRSPEYKDEREQLVTEVNAFLDSKLAERDAGVVIGDKPLIITTQLGRTAHGMLAMGTDSQYGEALWKDPKTGATRYEKVSRNEDGHMVRLKVTGTDPFFQQVGLEYTPGSNDVYATFHEETLDDGGTLAIIGGSIHGDGSVKQDTFTDKKFYGTHTLYDAAKVTMLRTAFSEMVTDETMRPQTELQ